MKGPSTRQGTEPGPQRARPDASAVRRPGSRPADRILGAIALAWLGLLGDHGSRIQGRRPARGQDERGAIAFGAEARR